MLRIRSLAAVTVLLGLAGSWASAQELDPNLRVLQPLIDSAWTGRMVAFGDGRALPAGVPMAAPGFYRVRWEVRLGGKVLQALESTSNSPDSPERVTYYWDATLGQIAYLALTQRTLDRGTIREENGRFIRSGSLTFANDAVDYIDNWELTSEGTLVQRYAPAKGNGHVKEMRRASAPTDGARP